MNVYLPPLGRPMCSLHCTISFKLLTPTYFEIPWNFWQTLLQWSYLSPFPPTSKFNPLAFYLQQSSASATYSLVAYLLHIHKENEHLGQQTAYASSKRLHDDILFYSFCFGNDKQIVIRIFFLICNYDLYTSRKMTLWSKHPISFLVEEGFICTAWIFLDAQFV